MCKKDLIVQESDGGRKEWIDVSILFLSTDFNPRPGLVYTLWHHLRKDPGCLSQVSVKKEMTWLVGTTRVRIFPIFLQAVNDPDEEPVIFVVLTDIMQSQSEESGLPSQPAAPCESWKTPFRKTAFFYKVLWVTAMSQTLTLLIFFPSKLSPLSDKSGEFLGFLMSRFSQDRWPSAFFHRKGYNTHRNSTIWDHACYKHRPMNVDIPLLPHSPHFYCYPLGCF